MILSLKSESEHTEGTLEQQLAQTSELWVQLWLILI